MIFIDSSWFSRIFFDLWWFFFDRYWFLSIFLRFLAVFHGFQGACILKTGLARSRQNGFLGDAEGDVEGDVEGDAEGDVEGDVVM